MTLFSTKNSKPKADRLQQLLDQKGIIVMPGCYDALTAKMIEREGLDVGFMSGFCVSSTKLGMPDTGLISFQKWQNKLEIFAMSLLFQSFLMAILVMGMRLMCTEL